MRTIKSTVKESRSKKKVVRFTSVPLIKSLQVAMRRMRARQIEKKEAPVHPRRPRMGDARSKRRGQPVTKRSGQPAGLKKR
jgi:hypothetical protein